MITIYSTRIWYKILHEWNYLHLQWKDESLKFVFDVWVILSNAFKIRGRKHIHYSSLYITILQVKSWNLFSYDSQEHGIIPHKMTLHTHKHKHEWKWISWNKKKMATLRKCSQKWKLIWRIIISATCFKTIVLEMNRPHLECYSQVLGSDCQPMRLSDGFVTVAKTLNELLGWLTSQMKFEDGFLDLARIFKRYILTAADLEWCKRGGQYWRYVDSSSFSWCLHWNRWGEGRI